jgi:predicted DCC family thiol-disulfide oxidoreductase YuxK
MERLSVLYDPTCELCLRCRDWIERQPAYVELELLPFSSDEARSRFGEIPWLGGQLVVVADDGRVWAGSSAFVVCLWALRQWREWALRLATPELSPLAERFFRLVSTRRKKLGALFSHSPCASDSCPAATRGPYR